MISKTSTGRILFVFSDPGGAKPCLSLSQEIDRGRTYLVSDRDYSFYSLFNVDVTIIEIKSVATIINDFDPDLVFTGTSYTSNIELEAIKIAKSKGIKTISFVDHYTSIYKRFSIDGYIANFPDEIVVIDEEAKKIAVNQGIDKSLVKISANPYHKWLRSWRPSITRDDFIIKLGLSTNKSYILFAPDPLSNINGIEKFNFDEFVASKNIVDLVNNASEDFKNNFHFLVKPHPNQSIHKLENIFRGNENFTFLPLDIDVNLSVFFSNVVLGFFSSILVEALIMNVPVLRFFEKTYKNDPFKDKGVGIISNENLIGDIQRLTLKD